MTSPRALVLGGRGDIGSSIAAQLSTEGFDVLAVGSIDFDLSILDSIDQFFASKDLRFDVVVHCAATNTPNLVGNISARDVKRSLDVNLIGFIHIINLCLPHFKIGGGKVIIISSLYGFLARKGRLCYTTSKHALVGAMKSLAIELAPYGVLVNAVSPGYISTRMTVANNSPEDIEKFEAAIPLRRLGEPSDIAEVVSFLVSDNNKYLTGQDIVVDGGYSCGGFQG